MAHIASATFCATRHLHLSRENFAGLSPDPPPGIAMAGRRAPRGCGNGPPGPWIQPAHRAIYIDSEIIEPAVRDSLPRRRPHHGGVTVSTGLLAAKRHAGVWAPVIAWKNIIANNQLAYAA